MDDPVVGARAANTVRTRRLLGVTGAAAGVLWSALTVWEHQAHLGSGPMTGARLANQLAFAAATIGYIAMLVGLHRARPAGAGRAARTFTVLLVIAWLLIVAGQLAQILTNIDQDADPLLPLGGLLQGIAALAVGITVARRAAWTGWQRWWPLILGVYYIAVLLVPAFAGHDPSVLTESIWALTYAVLGVALATSTHARAAP
jgi:hypothetical protein